MAVDIRRMNHEQLEELNRTGREWRERKLGQPMPDPAPALESPEHIDQVTLIFPEQLPLL
jgi:hypothetical protein